MAIQEKATEQKAILLANTPITSETTTYSDILDTAEYDAGVYFLCGTSLYDSTGDATYVVQEGAEANMSDATTVAAANLVYGTAMVFSAVNADSAGIRKEAAFGTKRYLRIAITTDATVTAITPLVIAIVNPPVIPTASV